MPRFRKLPVEIEAVHWSGNNADEVTAFLRDSGVSYTAAGEGFYIDTLEGTMYAAPEDWIIRGVQGEVYPCKPDIFTQTYTLISN